MNAPDREQVAEGSEESEGARGARAVKAPAPYCPPRIVKKRAVSRATLFTGSGPDGGGVIGSG